MNNLAPPALARYSLRKGDFALARSLAELVLSHDEMQTLKTWAGRPKSTQRLAMRAKIVLACVEGLENQLILDNDATHTSAAVKRWFPRHPESRRHFTPTRSSWLNLVERCFAEITQRRIRRGAFRSVAALEAAIRDYLEHHNASPKPFVWTADAGLILNRIKNVSERTSDSRQEWVNRFELLGRDAAT